MFVRCHRCSAELQVDASFCGMCGATLVDSNVGRVIARRYVLREKIGAGSLGMLYRAEQIGLGRKLAIKMLAADARRDPQVVERFRREGELLCRLRSAHTVTTYEFDRDADGSLYIAMELPAGRTLAEVIRGAGLLDWVRTLRILAGLCDSLAEAHALGIVHRDLRPENILLEDRPGTPDFVKVLDFGLAKMLPGNMYSSPPGETIGAVEYASPEQLLMRPIDARSDIYALGVLGYLMITGRHPLHDARTFGDLVAAHIHRVPAPASSLRSDMPPDVDAVLARCLDKDPERRYPDAPALAAMIGVVLAGVPRDTGDTVREPDRLSGEEDTVFAGRPKPK
jgi:serine/threonine-protein kinase